MHQTVLIMPRGKGPMTMRSKLLVSLVVMIALPAVADRAHDLFKANREKILSKNFSVIDGTVFVVGRSKSTRNCSDSVGWAKAESSAKWFIGDRFLATARWPLGTTEDEKRLAWLEYRAMHPHRFKITGMQRVWTQKTPLEDYMVVLSIPASEINLSPPSRGDLETAVKKVRERQRTVKGKELRQSEQKKAEAEGNRQSAGYREEVDGVVRQQQVDEDLIL